MLFLWFITQIFLTKHYAALTLKKDLMAGLGLVQHLTTSRPMAARNQKTTSRPMAARNQRQPANQHGDWWIGGYEDRPSKWATAGRSQLDEPQGTLTSPTFDIQGNYISFLIGGGCDIDTIRAELIVDDRVSKTLNLVKTGFTLSELKKNRLVSPIKMAG